MSNNRVKMPKYTNDLPKYTANVNILSSEILPRYVLSSDDFGVLHLYNSERVVLPPKSVTLVKTGISFVDDAAFGIIMAGPYRYNMGPYKDLHVLNGLIDPDFRNEIRMQVYNDGDSEIVLGKLGELTSLEQKVEYPTYIAEALVLGSMYMYSSEILKMLECVMSGVKKSSSGAGGFDIPFTGGNFMPNKITTLNLELGYPSVEEYPHDFQFQILTRSGLSSKGLIPAELVRYTPNTTPHPKDIKIMSILGNEIVIPNDAASVQLVPIQNSKRIGVVKYQLKINPSIPRIKELKEGERNQGGFGSLKLLKK